MHPFDELPEPLEGMPAGAEGAALSRLRQAAARERRCRRRAHRAMAVIAATVVFSLTFASLPPRAPEHVVPLLGLAVAVESLPEVSPPPGTELRSITRRHDLLEVPVGNDGSVVTIQVTSTLELWMTADGVIRTEAVVEPARMADGAGDEASSSGSMMPLPDPEVVEAMAIAALERGAEATTGLGLAGGHWPTSEQELIRAMRRHVAGTTGESEEVKMLSLAASLIRGNPDAPDRRGRLLRVVAAIPGLEVRSVPAGIEVSLAFVEDSLPLRLAYLLDGTTGDLLGERLEMIDPAGGPVVMSVSEFTPWQLVVPGDPD